MSRGAIATIDVAALAHNVQCVRQWAPHAKILAMVKSNGYGHGFLRAVHGLSTVDAYGVACLEEALALREVGIDAPIVVMAGPQEMAEIVAFGEYQFSAVIHTGHQLAWLAQAQGVKPFPVWLKLDSGMHRLGFLPSEFAAARQRLTALSLVSGEIVYMTHLADADNPDTRFTEQQLVCFTQHVPSGCRSAANSAAILKFSECHYDWVRPGLLLYGVSPLREKTGLELGLRPVMTLSARIMVLKTVACGESVGYGCDYHAPENMLMGIVALGYGDGYPRHAMTGTPILVNGVRCPLIGRVSMDMLAVDLRSQPNVQEGDSVVLWGEGLPVETVAEYASTIPYTLLCGVAPRVRFAEVV
ncbi:MAG: alanine racemase [Gammaproteobacteria bacterium RIFCSPHIGHO2_12_FULL_45_9]|nr:MAG: alanine racemase [Gammaproteobacteria bacterium RIFCSPHIGHO2_12_FULL_45_9]